MNLVHIKVIGSGTVVQTSAGHSGRFNQIVKLKAIPSNKTEFIGCDRTTQDSSEIHSVCKIRAYRFVQWIGDASGTDPNYTIMMDRPKSITAEFEQVIHLLKLQVIGSGEGNITTKSVTQNRSNGSSSVAQHRSNGSSITLIASATRGSKFKQWGADFSGTDLEINLAIEKSQTITAEFVKLHSLVVSTQGKGIVKRGVIAAEYETGSKITLTAIPLEGHEFVQWHGASTGKESICIMIMDAPKSVQAEFRPLSKPKLEVTYTGTGHGVVYPNKQVCQKGSVVKLVAKAAEGCIFEGWGGDLHEGSKEIREITLNSDLTITASFKRITLPNTDIFISFDEIKFNDDLNSKFTTFYFNVKNCRDREIRIKMPLAGFVTEHKEEIEQSGWAKGTLDAGKWTILRADTFRKVGLAFDRHRISKVVHGEHLHITLLQNEPAQRITFSYRCTDEDNEVMALVYANVEPLEEDEVDHSVSTASTAQADLTVRMQLLEKSLQEALGRLNAQTASPPAAVPIQTLSEVLAWLCTQNSVPMAVLRQKLLPLGLMPSAVMDDVNERAFDVAGEPALEETADIVTVQRGVLLRVMAVW